MAQQPSYVELEIHIHGRQAPGYPVGLTLNGEQQLGSGTLLLEIKVAPVIEPVHKAQALSYLKVTDADLAIVANFGGASLEGERLPNFLQGGQAAFTWQPKPVDCFLLLRKALFSP